MSTGFLLVLLFAFQAPPDDGAKAESVLQKMEREVQSVVDTVQPSVVSLCVYRRSSGVSEETILSAVSCSAEGHLVTILEAVEGADRFEVRPSPGVRKEAKWMGGDRRSGLALLRWEEDGGRPVGPAGGVPLEPRSWAVVVGGAERHGGTLLGVVNGPGLRIRIGEREFDDRIPISGIAGASDAGSLVTDLEGRMIGILQSVAVERSGRGEIPVSWFVIPADEVRFVSDQLVRHGKVRRGWAGLTLAPLEGEAARNTGLPPGQGAEVRHVEAGSPAFEAGLRTLDVLVSFDGKPVQDLKRLRRDVESLTEPRQVAVSYLRKGEKREAGIGLVIREE